MRDRLAKLEITRSGAMTLVTLTGEIDLSNGEWLQSEIQESAVGSNHLIVDLSGIDFMDSQGVRLLHDLAKSLSLTEVLFEVIAPSDGVAAHVLRLTRMDERFTIHESAP